VWRGCRREQAREISAAESKPSFAKMGNDGEPSMGDEGGEDMYCFRCRDKENDIVTGEQRPVPPLPLPSPLSPHHRHVHSNQPHTHTPTRIPT